jgi:hypothetical protein
LKTSDALQIISGDSTGISSYLFDTGPEGPELEGRRPTGRDKDKKQSSIK